MAVWVEVLEVEVVLSGILCGVSTVLAHIHFVPPLFVSIGLIRAMNLLAVGLKGATLGKCLSTH